MGVNAMASDRSAEVVREAFMETGDVARKPKVTSLLAPLVTRDEWLDTAPRLDDDPALALAG